MAGVAVSAGLVKGAEDNREYNIAAMVILALETVTRAGSLALCTDGGTGTSMTGDPSRTHGVRLPNELRQFVESHGQTLQSIDYFAVVTGPGSFTGLRIGLATVQGLAFANGRSTIGIPTLEAMASGWLEAQPPGADGLVVASLDAARGEVFYSAWDVTGATSIEASAPVIEPRVAAPEQVARELAALQASRITLVGPGAVRYTSTFATNLTSAHIETVMPNLAAAACRLAARRIASATPPHALRPVYVRRPDAELARERAVLARASARPKVAGATDGIERGLVVFEVTTPGDLSEVAQLQERAFGNGWGAEAFGGELAALDVARLYAARVRSGELVAYCACWQVVDELHINSLAVDPAVRRRGVATALLRQVMATASTAGATAATLEVRESNLAGRTLYENLGFKVEGVRRGYYQNPREDALILWHRGLALW